MRTKPNFSSVTGSVNGDVNMAANVQQPTMSASINASGDPGSSMSMAPGGGSGSVSVSHPQASGSIAVNAAVPTSNVAVSAGYHAGAAGNVSISASVPMPAVNLTMETGRVRSDKAEFSMEFQGYGEMSLNAASSILPPPPSALPSGPPPEMVFSSTTMLSEAGVRQALLNHARSSTCYGLDPAKDMVVVNILPSSSLEYILETFCESRETKMAEDPYKGGFVDGPSFGPPPLPWNIPCKPDSLFYDHEKKIEVPHTASVQPCQKCSGRGYLHCTHCQGSGRVTCGSCNGSGHTFEPGGGAKMEPCFTCGGDGRNRCGTCSGDGRTTCSNCEGFGKVKNYIKLKVSYRNHKSDYILKCTDIPDDQISQVSGATIFEQTLPQVWPITNYPVPNINAQSQQLIHQHRTTFPMELQLYQRQTLRAVPVTEVHYSMERLPLALLGLRGKPKRLRARLPGSVLLHHPLAVKRACWSRDENPPCYCASSSYGAVSTINGPVRRV